MHIDTNAYAHAYTCMYISHIKFHTNVEGLQQAKKYKYRYRHRYKYRYRCTRTCTYT